MRVFCNGSSLPRAASKHLDVHLRGPSCTPALTSMNCCFSLMFRLSISLLSGLARSA